MVSDKLQKKIDAAIRLIQSAEPNDGSPLEVAYSGGKDSDVLLQLVKESGVNYRVIYKNTTIDPPGTIKHVKEHGVEIIRPKHNFAQIVAKKGLPSRWRRFCCEQLKEYKVLDRCVLGVRREESNKRAKRYQEPTCCRKFTKTQYVEQFYPILYWSLKDVVEFAADRNITFAPVYYDSDGTFHPERRLGCMCCPLASRKHRIAEFKRYPNMVKVYVRSIQKYIEAHPNSKVSTTYNCYEAFAHDVLCNVKGEWEKVNAQNLFGTKIDWKKEIEKMFEVNLPQY